MPAAACAFDMDIMRQMVSILNGASGFVISGVPCEPDTCVARNEQACGALPTRTWRQHARLAQRTLPRTSPSGVATAQTAPGTHPSLIKRSVVAVMTLVFTALCV